MFLYKHFIEPSKSAERGAREKGEALSEEDADIRRNLEVMLSTKRGCGYVTMDTFGLSDVGFRTPEKVVELRTREIEENIRLYEPRVEVIKINDVYDDDGKRVRLVVHLRRRSAGSRLNLVVDLERGTFDVEPAREPESGKKGR